MTQYTSDGTNDTERREEYKKDFRSYVMGCVLALPLTLLPFALVYWDVLPRHQAFIVIGVCALVQMVVHFRFFLHIGLKRKREDLHLILFSTLLLLIMVAGTLWIMINLDDRMMPDAMAWMDLGNKWMTGNG